MCVWVFVIAAPFSVFVPRLSVSSATKSFHWNECHVSLRHWENEYLGRIREQMHDCWVCTSSRICIQAREHVQPDEISEKVSGDVPDRHSACRVVTSIHSLVSA